MSQNIVVRYEDFGAIGDGITNDFAAMRAAHAYANERGLKVVAECGKTYLIEKSGTDSIIIKTDTVWQGATVVVDDRNIFPDDPERMVNVIIVESDYKKITHSEDSELVKSINAGGGIKTDTKKIPYAPGYPAMLVPFDTTHKVYVRYGPNKNSGSHQHEVMLIDGEGNVDSDTPVLLDYNNISYVDEYRVDDKPITLLGGTFITRANSAPCAYTYYRRNMVIKRSNVTVDGLKYRITDEGDHGAPYKSFVGVQDMNNLLVVNCDFQAHRYYMNEDPKTGGPTNMGTYAIGGSNSNKLYYKNCKQVNFFDPEGNPTSIWYDENGNTGMHNTDPEKKSGIWGVMGTNYCKNITYDNCILNRLDAHAGVYNASIINGSQVRAINLIGGGTARIEDSTVYNFHMINLRTDYGSVWDGDIIIKNSKFVSTSDTQILIRGTWNNHDFGYKTHMPNVEIENLDVVKKEGSVYLFNDFGEIGCEGDFSLDTVVIKGERVENKNPMTLPERISIKNCTREIKLAPESCWLGRALNKD